MREALRYTDLPADQVLDRLLDVGGFPEPFLRGSRSWYARWKRTHIDAILKEDLLTLSAVRRRITGCEARLPTAESAPRAGDVGPHAEERLAGRDVQRPQVVAPEGDVGDRVLVDGDVLKELAGR